MTADELRQPSRTRPRDIAVLLGCLAGLLVAAEVATARLIVPSSRIQRRIDGEVRSARGFGGQNTFLLVGNSLLLFAMPDTQLSTLLPAPYTTRRLAIEQTAFIDWKHALRSLDRAGTHASVVGLMLDPIQLVGNTTRSDYTAWQLLAAPDVVPMGASAHMHPTEISRMVLSHFSTYYGFRSEARKVLLSRLIPGVDGLVRLLTFERAAPLDSLPIHRIAEERLALLKREVEARGSRLILLVPPTQVYDFKHGAVEAAAAAAGVDIVLPDVSRPYVAADFTADGYHLSERGSARYVNEARADLRRLLAPLP